MVPSGNFFWLGLPAFVCFAAIEFVALRRRGRPYRLREGLTSLALGVGYKLSAVAGTLVTGWLFFVVFDRRVATVPLDTVWGLLVLFLAVEFAYYWFHRLSHEIRWMWATHAVHHSSEDLNILAAFRLGWSGTLSGAYLVYLPLAWLGLHPLAVGGMLALGLVYQVWIHTELVGRLGVLESVLNTPSSHRVHHANNPEYVGHNYGAVLIVFDRLFGTYTPERADTRCRYGLEKPLRTLNPFRIAFHEWGRMAQDVAEARSWSDRLGYLFGRPGWRPAAAAAPRPAQAQGREMGDVRLE